MLSSRRNNFVIIISLLIVLADERDVPSTWQGGPLTRGVANFREPEYFLTAKVMNVISDQI